MEHATVRAVLVGCALASVMACGSSNQSEGDAGARDSAVFDGGGESGNGSGGSDSGAVSDGDASAAVYCVVTARAAEHCEGYPDLPANLVASAEKTCANLMGTLATQCPPSNQIGCCRQPFAGLIQDTCYYCGVASDLQMTCVAQSGATWTAGSGGPDTCGDGGAVGD
jgi:hypothetical protein